MVRSGIMSGSGIIKYIPLQQGLRLLANLPDLYLLIIKYIPLQQGLRPFKK